MMIGHGDGPGHHFTTYSPQSIFAHAKRNVIMKSECKKEAKLTKISPPDLTLAWIQRPEVVSYFPSIAAEAVRFGLGRHAWEHMLDDAEGKWYKDKEGNMAFVRDETQLVRLVLFKADRSLAAHLVHHIKG